MGSGPFQREVAKGMLSGLRHTDIRVRRNKIPIVQESEGTKIPK